MGTQSSLFSEFDPTTKQEWIDKVIADLKGADFEKVMAWQTEEGFSVDAMYMESDKEAIQWVQQFENELFNPEKAHIQNQYWQNCPIIEIPSNKEAQKHGLEALQSGAEALLFQLENTPDFNVLLEEILLPYCGIYFSGNINLETLKKYFEYAAAKGYDFSKLEGGFQGALQANVLVEAIQITSKSQEFKVVGIEAKGNTISERISAVISAVSDTIENLEKEGITPQQVFENLYVKMPISSNYFLEIAGLRALRILLSQLASLYEVEMLAYQFTIHAFTTLEEGEEDTYQFMLSNTIQAMSAIIGGANVLTVLPHTFKTEKNSRFALRIARNVSTILKEESYLDKVADPSAGSYYIDTLTAKLAEKAWEIFQQ